MNRSPLAYPLTRSLDGGGDAELQTDVMRFMAILSLCLVAIFALVQSIPSPAPPSPPENTMTADDPAIPAAPVPQPVVLTRPPRPQMTKPEPAPPLQRSAPARPAAAVPVVAAAAEPVSTPVPPAAAPTGFSLRFESDAALLRLVAREAVAFYALSDGSAKRMQVEHSRVSFWPSATPPQVHEMDASTVPDKVISALGRDAGHVNWGVALPNAMSQRLVNILNERDGGDIVIGADGNLRVL